MLSRIGYGLAALLVTALAVACLAWTLLEPPSLPVPPRGVVVIKDVTLVNPGLGRAEHVDITVRAGVITAIGPTTAAVSRYDLRCAGCFALPGLIDMSVQLSPRRAIGMERAFGLSYLQQGVTTVRETGSIDGGVYAARDAVAAGRWPGPRLIACGRALGHSGWRDVPPIRTSRDVRAAMADDRAEGARCISIQGGLSHEAIRVLVEEAARSRLPVVGRVPHTVSLLEAPYLADVQGLSGVALRTGTEHQPFYDYLCADFAALSDDRVAAIVEAAVRQHTAHTPLLAAGPPRETNESDDICNGIEARRGQVTWALMRAGVPVYAGSGDLRTDMPLRPALEAELRRFAALGLTPEQALATATTSPGRFWPDATYGQIAIGLPADMVLYRRDPTASLDNLASRQSVIADGRFYASADLDAWARRYRMHFCGLLNRLVRGDGWLIGASRRP